MAKNFGRANSAKMIKEVAKASGEKANIIQIRMLGSESLLDFPKNHEDCENTADLENSMKELGFTDPIEVTDYDMEEGMYTIVSGHRRRVAGLRVGIETFPCIVKPFNNEHDMRNYVLLANSQRDTAKDPLLFCKRYKMHEEYLKESGFEGSIREEIAKRLGISSQQADRYNQFNKIILPVWDMVRSEKVGMSSVLPMAVHSIEEQEKILAMMNDYLDSKKRLTREICDKIIKGYRAGMTTLEEIFNFNEGNIEENEVPLNSLLGEEFNKGEERVLVDEPLVEEDWEESTDDNSQNKIKPKLTDSEMKLKRGIDIRKNIESLEKCFDDLYVFVDEEMAESAMGDMCELSKRIFEELLVIGNAYNKESVYKNMVKELLISLG